ncbi:unnamed protein product [Sphagnum balticum]
MGRPAGAACARHTNGARCARVLNVRVHRVEQTRVAVMLEVGAAAAIDERRVEENAITALMTTLLKRICTSAAGNYARHCSTRAAPVRGHVDLRNPISERRWEVRDSVIFLNAHAFIQITAEPGRRRVQVRKYVDKATRVDIRQWHVDDGLEKPGVKGGRGESFYANLLGD